jgi:hypothetical protein
MGEKATAETASGGVGTPAPLPRGLTDPGPGPLGMAPHIPGGLSGAADPSITPLGSFFDAPPGAHSELGGIPLTPGAASGVREAALGAADAASSATVAPRHPS